MPADIKTHPSSNRAASLEGGTEPRIIPYADITAIAFTGKDTADGKSWDAWVSKKEHERQAEADRIKAEAVAQGHL
jgi:hypothetical protein